MEAPIHSSILNYLPQHKPGEPREDSTVKQFMTQGLQREVSRRYNILVWDVQISFTKISGLFYDLDSQCLGKMFRANEV